MIPKTVSNKGKNKWNYIKLINLLHGKMENKMRRYSTQWKKITANHYISDRSDQIRSVAQLCPTLCDPMNRSTPGLLVHHQLPEFTETHVH